MDPEELTQLDIEVARVLGLTPDPANEGNPTGLYVREKTDCGWSIHPFWPTREWSDAGPLVEKYGLSLQYIGDNWDMVDEKWTALTQSDRYGDRTRAAGPTSLVAICRAVVALREEVNIDFNEGNTQTVALTEDVKAWDKD